MDLQLFTYSLVRFVPDLVRGEAVNLGVVVVAPHERHSAGRVLSSFRQKVQMLDPGCDPDSIERMLGSLVRRFQLSYQGRLSGDRDERVTSVEALSALGRIMCNQIRLSEPRPYRASSLEVAVEELFTDLVAPLAKPVAPAERMTVSKIRDLIRATIKRWSDEAIHIDESAALQAKDARHFADFWLSHGEPAAALIAIPDDPEEQAMAWTRRDSVPTIAREFRKLNPEFHAVAVFPPGGGQLSAFIEETREFFGNEPGVLALRVDELADWRDRFLPPMLVAPVPEPVVSQAGHTR